SGFFFGCALVFNQKLLLAGPGVLLFALLYSLRQSMRQPRARVVGVVSFAVAWGAPLGGLFAYFWSRAAAGDFVTGVLITNLGWPREVSAVSTLKGMVLRDPVLLARRV